MIFSAEEISRKITKSNGTLDQVEIANMGLLSFLIIDRPDPEFLAEMARICALDPNSITINVISGVYRKSYETSATTQNINEGWQEIFSTFWDNQIVQFNDIIIWSPVDSECFVVAIPSNRSVYFRPMIDAAYKELVEFMDETDSEGQRTYIKKMIDTYQTVPVA